MYQENKEAAHVDYSSFSGVSNPYAGQQPLFRDISDIPRSTPGDFSVSSSGSPDVYRSLQGGTLSEPQPLSFMSSSAFPAKDLDLQPPRFGSDSFHWEEIQSHTATFEKSKAMTMEDVRGPLIQSFPATSSSVASLPAVPPPLPDYVDPNYNFSSNVLPADLFQSMQTLLKAESVDVEAKPAKFRLKCTAYPNNCVLSFVVRVYRGESDKTCVVECQRRKGDVIPFARLFRSLKSQADPNIRDSASVSVSSISREDEWMNEEHAQETTQCLLLMAKSQFVDVQSKAVEALASLSSQDKSVQELLIKQGSVSLLLDGCVAKTEDVHRPALTALANLADGRAEVCRIIASDKALRSLSEQFSSPKDNCPQVVRECARVLSAVGQSVKRLKTTTSTPVPASSAADSAALDIDYTFVSTAVQNLSCSKDPLTLLRAREIEECFDLEGMC